MADIAPDFYVYGVALGIGGLIVLYVHFGSKRLDREQGRRDD